MPLLIEKAKPHKFSPFQGPSTDRPTDRCKKCTDRTDREEFKEVTELKPFLTRSVRSVYFLQQSVEQSVDGLWTVPASRVSNPSQRIQVGNIVLLSGLV